MNKHDERRSSLRRPVHHEAVIKVNEDLILNCIIADFCLDGMFIKFMSESANRLLDLPEVDDENIRIELSFTGEKGKLPLSDIRRQSGDRSFAAKEKHQPMRTSLVGLLGNHGEEMQVLGGYFKPSFFLGLTDGAFKRRFSGGHL